MQIRRVLNACWHHGIDHLSFLLVDRMTTMPCSTPAGITESITVLGVVGVRHLFGVLNACWHHGIDHRRFQQVEAKATMCSTPAGITESITPHRLTGWSKSNLPGVISTICLVGCRTSR